MAYVGEVRMFAGNYAPAGWEFCSGQLVNISEYEMLFNLIGTTYGGDGQSTFALPDLRGRVPIHQGTGGGGSYALGQTGGAEQVTLTSQQIPNHTHQVLVSTSVAGSRSAVGGVPAALPSEVAYAASANVEPMGQTSSSGGSQPHENMQPWLGVNFIISMLGDFPIQA